MIQKQDEDNFDKAEVAGGYLAAGAAAGVVAAEVIGDMGLAVGGTAVAIGAAPVIAAGAVVGMAAYGFKKFLESF